jgi:hypothetical protein
LSSRVSRNSLEQLRPGAVLAGRAAKNLMTRRKP